MPRSFEWSSPSANGTNRGIAFWLKVTAGILAVLNAAALFLYISPPGGTRRQLAEESLQVRNQIAAARAQTVRLRTVSGKVQTGSTETSQFEGKYILPKRAAYEEVIGEIQRMAKAAGFQERDAVFTEEPIEGTADLSLLNITASYQGSYDNLMHFLHEADRSPMLLILDNLQAAPQQKGGQINTSIRFQAVIRENAGGAVGGQP
jgi:Tfp pilus assembly protein PilO